MAESSAVKEEHQCKKRKYQCKLQIKILEPDLQSTGVRDWNIIKRKFPEGFRSFASISEHFRTFPKIFNNFQKVSEDRFENFLTFSEFFRRFPTIFEDFKNQNCCKVILSTLRQISDFFRRFPKPTEDFRRFPKIYEDFRRFSKNSETCRTVCFCTLRCFFLSYPKNFQTFNKGDTNPYFR